ncbi:hypothetical protein [Candidatus Phytoplasma prunorum]|uniref:hypothetical protein n=1 Tax=Candidatus Phytoplasma prunorum TaxID=47565 RepID=UPI002FF38DB8
MPSNKKIRIQYKNIIITYHNCFEIPLEEIKAFFLRLFQNIYTTNKIKYLLVAKNKVDKIITVLLILDKKPDFKNIDKFIINNDEPIFDNDEYIKSFETEIKADTNFEWKEDGDSNQISNNTSFQKQKELDFYFYEFITILKQRFWYIDKNMTTEDAKKEIYSWLKENKHNKIYQGIPEINRILTEHFTRNNYDFEDDDIENYQTFKNDLPILRQIKTDILNQIKTVKQNHRPRFINIEGTAKIGKTEFIKSFLQHHNIKFNLISGKLKFEKYNDNAEVDIYDDSNYFHWDQNQEGIEYAKRLIGCNHKGLVVWKNKYQPLLTLKKNKLSIIINNPGKHSFFNWAISDKNSHKNYIADCNGIFHILGNQKLYITKSVSNQSTSEPQASPLRSKFIDLFERKLNCKDIIEFIDD